MKQKLIKTIGLVYRINRDFRFYYALKLEMIFYFIRDNLIKEGKLNPPFTLDPEYSKILIDGIREWNGKEFVKFPAEN